MRFTAATKVGFTAIVIGIVLVAVSKGMDWNIPGLDWLGKKTYTITVQFANVKGLAKGADVQLNGNPIGQVGAIVPNHGVLDVYLLINSDRSIHKNAGFTISRENIFGGYILSVEEAPSGWLEGDVVNGQAVIRVAKGSVALNGLVYMENVQIGQTTENVQIGQITSISPAAEDSLSELAVVSLNAENANIRLDDTMAFVPQPLASGEPAGLTVYTVIPAGHWTAIGQREPGPEELVAEADKKLIELSDQISTTMGELGEVLGSVKGLIDKAQVTKLLDTVSAQAVLIADNVSRITSRLDTMLAENQPHINQTMQNMEGITSDARTLMAGLSEYNDPEFRQKVEDIATNLATATDSLNKVLQDIEGLTSDQELKDQIRGTITQARSTLEQAQTTLHTADTALNEASNVISTAGGIETSGQFTLRYAPDPDRWVGELDARFGLQGSDAFILGGINDIGERERLNAQLGWWINSDTSARVGIHRGKIGLGFDWQSDSFSLETDLYNPNDLRWDLYGGYAFLPELGVVVGVEDLFGCDQFNMGLAFRF